MLLAGGILAAGGYVYNQLDSAAKQRRAAYQYQPAANPSLPPLPRGKAQARTYQPYCQQPQSDEDADLCAQWAAVEQVSESNRLASTNIRLTLLIIILSFFGTVALVWTLFETWRTTRRELRAYVMVDHVGISDRQNEQFPARLRGLHACIITIRNSGQTPAYEVIHWGEMMLLPVAEEKNLQTPKLVRVHESAIAPGSTNTKIREFDRKLTRAEIAALRKGEMAFFVWGRIEYVDTFGKRHFTNYRMSGARWPIGDQLNPIFCAEGNNAS